MEINSYGKSDIGKVRNNNEDYLIKKKISNSEYLFIVADGMGGHQAGNIASKLGAETFLKYYSSVRKKGVSIQESMLESINQANSAILDKATSEIDKRGMGTTFSSLLISDNEANIIHIGDSRIYLVRDGKIKKVTTDHTFVEKMVDEGRITSEEARVHPQKNILYMSLGAREVFHPDEVKGIKIENNDIFLICSDGLTDMVTDDVIKEYCELYSPEKAVNELIALSNKNGGLDNISIIIIKIGKETKNPKESILTSKLKKSRLLFLMVSMLFLSLIVFGSVILKQKKIQIFSNNSFRVDLKPLKAEERANLNLVSQILGISKNKDTNKFIDNDTLMVKTSQSISMVFSKEEFIVVKNGDILFRENYSLNSGNITLKSIYFDKTSNCLVAIDDKNIIYKLSVY